MRPILGITGATGVGKSEVAVNAAKLLGSEVISADSMQIYKYMNIGTAKLPPSRMKGIVHRMIDIVEPDEEYSAYMYQKQVSEILSVTESVPIVAGGTGFYFDSLLYPPEFGDGGNSQVRAELKELLDKKGPDALLSVLYEHDPATYESIDKKNLKRVLRATEIALSGEKKSQGRGYGRPPRYRMALFLLQRERNLLYRAVDERVDKMIADGLRGEAEFLLEKYGRAETSAFQAIGYKEMFDCIQGLWNEKEAAENIKRNTRHYCKRQITYFKRLPVCAAIDVDEFDCDAQKIAEFIAESYTKYASRSDTELSL